MPDIEISSKFKNLFKLFDDNFHPEVDTVIITGGRYSLKSYTVSIFALVGLVKYNWSALYTRFTNMSIVDSIKPEVSDKIELLNLSDTVTDTQSQIEYKNNRISFKGIKTGSQQQTANLKSLSGFNLFINDEAEELPDLKTFKKIFYSIRSIEKRNLTILILNPTDKRHWIFEEFFNKKGLEGGNNCIVDNVMYIHTSYLDCDINRMPKTILADYLRLKEDNPKEYGNIVLGGWIDEPEGILIPRSKIKFIDTKAINPNDIIYRFSIIDPADTGGDKYSQPFISICEIGGNIACLVTDVIHNTHGIEANAVTCIEKVKLNRSEQLPIEANGIGLAAVLLIKKDLPVSCSMLPFTSTVNKEARILSHYEFIIKHFYFDKTLYEQNNEYKSFINDVVSYTKEGENKHKKDAIDVLCSASQFIKAKYASVLFR